MRSYTRVIDIEKNDLLLTKDEFFFCRSCTKKLIGNVPREDERSWTSTIVDSKVFKWSPNPIQWPVCLI